MTQDEIIRMAREAGLEQVVSIDPKNGGIITKSLPPELLERFAVLVQAKVEAEWIETNKALAKEIIEQRNQYLDKLAEAIDLSVKAEREACAKVCEDDMGWLDNGGGELCAAAIRARGEK